MAATASSSSTHSLGQGQGHGVELLEYQFKIELLKLKPPLWRRVLVPSNMCFNDFHKVILCLFGWDGDHCHKFDIPDVEGAWLNVNPLKRLDIERKPISNFFKQVKDRADYTYDFGEGWVHHIELEGIQPVREGIIYPKCVAGRRVNLVEYPGENEEPDTTTKFKPSDVDFSRMEDFYD